MLSNKNSVKNGNRKIQILDLAHWKKSLNKDYDKYLTIIPRARMGNESIAHEAEGRMGY